MIQTQGVGRTSSVARWPRGGLTTIIRPRLIILLHPRPVPSPGAGSASRLGYPCTRSACSYYPSIWRRTLLRKGILRGRI